MLLAGTLLVNARLVSGNSILTMALSRAGLCAFCSAQQPCEADYVRQGTRRAAAHGSPRFLLPSRTRTSPLASLTSSCLHQFSITMTGQLPLYYTVTVMTMPQFTTCERHRFPCRTGFVLVWLAPRLSFSASDSEPRTVLSAFSTVTECPVSAPWPLQFESHQDSDYSIFVSLPASCRPPALYRSIAAGVPCLR